MEQTPLPPLVSDEQAKDMACTMELSQNLQESQIVYWKDKHKLIDRVRAIYEADRAKTWEVVQALVDGIETMRQGAFADAFIFANDAELDAHAKKLLALAKSQLNIKPN